jgi:hypothetical protein
MKARPVNKRTINENIHFSKQRLEWLDPVRSRGRVDLVGIWKLLYNGKFYKDDEL